MIRFLCPNCNKRCKVRADAGGRRAKCPRCGARLIVPSPEHGLTDSSAPLPETNLPWANPVEVQPVLAGFIQTDPAPASLLPAGAAPMPLIGTPISPAFVNLGSQEKVVNQAGSKRRTYLAGIGALVSIVGAALLVVFLCMDTTVNRRSAEAPMPPFQSRQFGTAGQLHDFIQGQAFEQAARQIQADERADQIAKSETIAKIRFRNFGIGLSALALIAGLIMMISSLFLLRPRSGSALTEQSTPLPVVNLPWGDSAHLPPNAIPPIQPPLLPPQFSAIMPGFPPQANRPEGVANVSGTASDPKLRKESTHSTLPRNLLFTIGILITIYYWLVFDTTVGTWGFGRVYNIGLLNTRLVGVIVGLGCIGLGALIDLKRKGGR